ncbi:hypothetical protein L1887_29597 [Cichorium endivia]|nr:hypothetical protein L1887_29597 [Cichorium endivia]
MDLRTSEMEWDRRLENLIARRRARKTMRMQAEKNIIDLVSVDLPWNIPPISTARSNPSDYDSNEHIPDNPPLEVSLASEVLGFVNSQTNPKNEMTFDVDPVSDTIDRDITLDSSQIDWDIGTVEDTGDGFGAYEIVNASEIPESSLNNGIEYDEINRVSKNVVNESQGIGQLRSWLLETEYRSRILDDLFEIKVFLNKRIMELTNTDTLCLQHQVQSVAPFVLQQYTSEAIQSILSDILMSLQPFICSQIRIQET